MSASRELMFETTYAKWLDREEDRAKLERLL
jgi:hypothetical protein